MINKYVVLSQDDSIFLRYLRGWAIISIVMSHLCGWVLPPYSQLYFAPYVPVFFMISGGLSYHSFVRAESPLCYILKKIVQIIVPYYLFCVLALIYHLVIYGFPDISLLKLWQWISISPHYELMPFSMGQIWFLHALVGMVFISSIVYSCFLEIKLYICLIVILIFLSFFQLYYPVNSFFSFFGRNYYQLIAYFIFFIFGSLYFQYIIKPKLLLHIFLISLCIFFALLFLNNVDPNPAKHSFSADIYFVSLSFMFISLLLLLKNNIINILSRAALFSKILKFMDINAFPIFFIHSFFIHISEINFGLVSPDDNFVFYAFFKTTFVFVCTCVAAVPFRYASKFLIDNVLILSRRGVLIS